MQAVAKVEASLLKRARKYFDENEFVEVVAPHLTKATGACENVATMFSLDYFGEQSYLSQTGQLHLETLTPFLKKVWCVVQVLERTLCGWSTFNRVYVDRIGVQWQSI